MRPARTAAWLVVALSLPWFATAGHAQVLPTGFNEELVVGGLNVPTCFVFAGDGHIFVGEQGGLVRHVEDGVLSPQPMLSLAVETFREQGLLGMALDPQFPFAPYIYIVYTPYTGFHTDNHHRVARFTVNGDIIEPASEVVLFDSIPTGIGYHVGGCIRFAADGNLLISAGDTNWAPPYPQDLTRLEGKLLRLHPDGSVPSDNPFVGVAGARPEIYQYGLRNPFRFSIQPGTGLAFIGDVGASAWEEINVGPPGANFGWPLYEGPETVADSTTVDPLFAYSHAAGSAAIVGNVFYEGNNFPALYEGNYFFFDHSRGTLGRMVLDAGNAVVSVDTAWAKMSFSGNGFGPVDLQIGTDGALYYSTYIPGQIRRIFYTGSENRRPAANARPLGATNGYAPLEVAFSGQDSYDVDGDSLSFDWNFGDGSPHASTVNPIHTYLINGIFHVILTVDDGHGGTAIATPIDVTVGNLGPIIEISAPTNGQLFLDSQNIVWSGAAKDPEAGPMAPSELHWRVLLHHLNHVHPTIIDQTGSSGNFVASFHQEEPQNIYYSITAWAYDVVGLRGERTVNIYPNPNSPDGTLRVFSIGADDRDAIGVAGETRVSGYSAGKPLDYVSNDAEQMKGGLEFSLDLPRGATILEAHLLLTAGPLQSPSTAGGLEIRAYDVADAEPFVNGPQDLGVKHPLTTTVVNWPAPPLWPEGDQVSSPDVSSLVQGFVNRGDYNPGQHLGFVVGKGSIDADAYYGWTDYAAIAAPTRLSLRYIVTTSTEIAPRSRLELRQNVPNPFNPTTRIEFTLAAAGRTRLEVLDVSGRLVRTLYDDVLPAGEHGRMWDGRDNRGRGVASGVYVYRLQSASGTASRRMVLAR